MTERIKFLLVGIVTSFEFQKCRCYIERLCKSHAKFYEQPDIRPMLNVDWNEYLLKVRRKIGGKLWELKKNAVVFVNGQYLGADVELLRYIYSKFKINIRKDFYKLGVIHLRNIIKRVLDLGRKFAYLEISIGKNVVGSMLFMLYEDYVPKTTKCFLRRCRKRHSGWLKTPIHRIVKSCWIQGGGFDLRHRRLACENYIVPHDRRGVISTCHSAKHTNTSIQYIISLNPTPWMDYKFVGFGQLIQGDQVLKDIEAVKTYYEAPKLEIKVTRCGEFHLEDDVDEATLAELSKYLDNIDPITHEPIEVLDPRDVPSELLESKYKEGLYCLSTDMFPSINEVDEYLKQCYNVAQEDDHEHPTETVLVSGMNLRAVSTHEHLSRDDVRFNREINQEVIDDTFKLQDVSEKERITLTETEIKVTDLNEPLRKPASSDKILVEDYKPLYV